MAGGLVQRSTPSGYAYIADWTGSTHQHKVRLRVWVRVRVGVNPQPNPIPNPDPTPNPNPIPDPNKMDHLACFAPAMLAFGAQVNLTL